MPDLAPIALFVYNRPRHTALTIEHLKKNSEAKDSKLFIFSDGPSAHKTAHHPDIHHVRNLIRNVRGFKEVTIIERETNWGLARSIIGGVTEIIQRYGQIIVLEDDLLTSPFFLKFMNEALELYKHEQKVFHIQGYMYPIPQVAPESFFTREPGSWGWATWRDRWDLFEPDCRTLLGSIQDRWTFDFDGSYPFFKMLKNQSRGKIDSWAIRWYATGYIHKMLALWPGQSLVVNIGFDGSGVHPCDPAAFVEKYKTTPVFTFPQEISENLAVRAAIIQFFKNTRPTLSKTLFNRVCRLFFRNLRGNCWEKKCQTDPKNTL